LIREGSVLTLERKVVLGSSVKDSRRKTVKRVVTKVRAFVDYSGEEILLVQLKGKKLRVFEVMGDVRRGYVLSSSEKPPMKYQLLTVDRKSV